MSLRSDIAGMPRPVWVLFAGTLVNRFGTFVLVFLALYLTRKGFTAPQAGLAMGAYGAGAIGASIVGGWLADHIGRRNSIVLSMLLSAAVMLVFPHAEGYRALLGLATFAGFCAELYRPAAAALIADVTTPAQRVTAYALYRFAINLGFAIGPAVGGFLAQHSFTLLFVGDAVTSLVYAGTAIAALPNRTGDHHGTAARRSALSVILRDAPFLMFIGSTFMAATVFMQHVSSYPLQLDAYGYSSAVFGMLISLNGVIICLTELPLTSVTRRRSARRVMTTGLVVIGAGFVMTGFVKSIPLLVTSVVIWTLGEMLYFPMASAHIANVSPPDMRGRYQGAWGIAWGLGCVLGPIGGTNLFAHDPRLVWIAAGVLALIGAMLVLVATRTGARQRAPAAL
ncbi:MAG TPA: MFS transporter [Candidatus Krumholzibacteria bacterium]|nr:MFS transporter [Candidatus Krumholzibacteria bacterium]